MAHGLRDTGEVAEQRRCFWCLPVLPSSAAAGLETAAGTAPSGVVVTVVGSAEVGSFLLLLLDAAAVSWNESRSESDFLRCKNTWLLGLTSR